MKFLIALSVLASSSVFAYDVDHGKWIKCYEPAQQGERGDVVYKMKAKHGMLHVVHPFHQPLSLNEVGCLDYPSIISSLGEQPQRLTLCEGQGQSINGLVPIEATYGQDEETVYCERSILPYFEADR